MRFCTGNRIAIHRYHRHGHLEKVYENTLAHRLRKAGLQVQQQYPLKVLDEDGTSIGEYFADLIVEDTLIVELKACRTLAAEHVAQILGYLRSARQEHGLLMNFGGYKFQIRKYAMSHPALDPGQPFYFPPFFAPFCGYLGFPDFHSFAANNLRTASWHAVTEAGVSSFRFNELPTPSAVAPAAKKSGALLTVTPPVAISGISGKGPRNSLK